MACWLHAGSLHLFHLTVLFPPFCCVWVVRGLMMARSYS